MKILAVADIHGSQHRLNLILKNIEKYSPELVVICGDLTQFGPGEVAKNLLNQIPIKTFVVVGNIDTPEVEKAVNDSKAMNIRLKKVEHKGIFFIGVSGLYSDDFKILSEKNILDEKSILVSHKPPYGTQDKVFFGKHSGSRELKEIIEKFKPRLVLCGHIHEDPGFTKIGGTVVVNCSMGKRGEGAFIELNGEISVNMLN